MKLLIAMLALVPTLALAQGNLVLYCAPQEEWCRAMVTAFERKTGVKVAMTRKSSGEIYAQVKAEASNPRGDIWWGGTGDPHLQAAEEDLTVKYVSPNASQLPAADRSPARLRPRLPVESTPRSNL
jgi:iron(III) transport system substrate-binding protein